MQRKGWETKNQEWINQISSILLVAEWYTQFNILLITNDRKMYLTYLGSLRRFQSPIFPEYPRFLLRKGKRKCWHITQGKQATHHQEKTRRVRTCCSSSQCRGANIIKPTGWISLEFPVELLKNWSNNIYSIFKTTSSRRDARSNL